MGQANIAQACIQREREGDPILHELLKLRVENARLALQVRQANASSKPGAGRMSATTSAQIHDLRDRLAQAEVDGELVRVHLAVAQERLQVAEARAEASNGSTADPRLEASADALNRLRRQFEEVTSHANGLDGALEAARAEHKTLKEAYNQIEGALAHARTELSTEQERNYSLEFAASRADTLQSELQASLADSQETASRTAELGDALAHARAEEADLRKAQADSEAAVQRAWFLAAAERDGREAEAAMAQNLQAELSQAQADLLSEQQAYATQQAEWATDRQRLHAENEACNVLKEHLALSGETASQSPMAHQASPMQDLGAVHVPQQMAAAGAAHLAALSDAELDELFTSGDDTNACLAGLHHLDRVYQHVKKLARSTMGRKLAQLTFGGSRQAKADRCASTSDTYP